MFCLPIMTVPIAQGKDGEWNLFINDLKNNCLNYDHPFRQISGLLVHLMSTEGVKRSGNNYYKR